MNTQDFVSGGSPENLAEYIRPGSEAGELAKQRLAAEVLSHEKESLRLRDALNAHAPINRLLPPEILSLIFLHYAAAVQEQKFAEFYLSSYRDDEAAAHKQIYTWHKVGWVCRAWREVALQCASLWRCLVVDERVPEDLLRLFLRRSQGATLTVIAHAVHQDYHCASCVHGEASTRNLDAGVEVLGEVTEWVTELKLYLSNVHYDAIWARLMGSGKRLRTLHIEAVGEASYEYHLALRQPPSVVVPSVLFEEHRPPLLSLSFWGVGLAWNSTLFCATLRRLDIAKCRVVSGTGIKTNMGDLLDALRRTPRLEELAFDELALPTRSDRHTRYDLVDLPRLRRLRVPNRHKNSITLAVHLRIPHDACIHFVGKDTKTFSAELLAGYTAGLPRLLDGMEAYAISHHSGYAHEQLKLWARVPPARDPAASADAVRSEEDPAWGALAATPPRLRFDCTLASGVAEALLRGLDARRIRALSVAQESFADRVWADVFAPATHITALRVQGAGAFALGAALANWKRPPHMNPPGTHAPHDHVGFGALLDDDDDDGDDDDARAQNGYAPGPPLFPRLRTLLLAAVDFPLEQTAPGREYLERKHFLWMAVSRRGSGDTPPYGLEVASVLKSLRVRARRGAAEVVRLEFERSQCWERERLAPLVGAVREVWWDGARLTPDDLGVQVKRDAARYRGAGMGERELSDDDWSG